MQKNLKTFLDKKVKEYNRPEFIQSDPISIPHLFSKKQDIEIAGFFAAIFAWGIRKTIINKSRALMELMDFAPHDFCVHHQESDLKKLEGFCHRTFNDTDLLYFISFFKYHYSQSQTLETAFFPDEIKRNMEPVESGLNYFYEYFFSLEHVPNRTKKHIASPAKKSTCKRLNMFLRWMVRRDNNGVDFGIWNRISPSQLIMPVDVHVARVARHFRLLITDRVDWQTAKNLTESLRLLDPIDPVKYDFALFNLGVEEKYQ